MYGPPSDASIGQLREARVLASSRPVVLADLARLPIKQGRLAGIVAFYCLIYGQSAQLNDVFGEWHRSVLPGGMVVIALHAGEGTIHIDEVYGRPVDMTIVLRDPDELVARLEASGFMLDERTVRPPYHDEHSTNRCYIVATRDAADSSLSQPLNLGLS